MTGQPYYRIKTAIIITGMLISHCAIFAQSNAVAVRNGRPKWKGDPMVGLNFQDHLGLIESDDESYLFYKPEDIASDSHGNLYVLDSGNGQVKKFDCIGRFILSFGRSGQGPGELSQAQCIEISDDDRIYVGDNGNQRIQIFSAAGEYINVINLNTISIEFGLLKDNRIVLREPGLSIGSGLKKGNVPLFRLLTPDGKLIRKFGQGCYFSEPPYSTGGNRCLTTTDKEGNAYVVFLFQNKILKFDKQQELVFTASRPLPKEKVTDKSPDMYTLISTGIDVDETGRIWVATMARDWNYTDGVVTPKTIRYDKKTGRSILPTKSTSYETDLYVLELFSSDGELLYRYPLDHSVDGVKIIEDRIYLVDTKRSMRFYIYQIDESL
ncbi:NHL repeat-containing protein [bacterium]|nr:NHL repeat-containing protein [bacterium]